MITSIYAAIAAFWIIFLIFKVVAQRRHNRVAYADGGVKSLQIARSAHANAVETIPLALLLLLLLELNGAPVWLLHILGISLLIGRVLHGRAILADRLKGRLIGMVMTISVIALAALANLLFFLMQMV